jgi:lipoprotein-releasing system permease protein
LYSESILNKFPGIFEWLAIQKVNERVLMIIMMIVAFINLATVVLILILDRSSMIGTLKSMGARDGIIMRVFVYLASGLVIKGMIIGNILALILIWLQDRYHLITLNQSDYYLSYAPVKLEIPQLFLINVFAFIIITIFLFVPSLLISRIKPINTLKFS